MSEINQSHGEEDFTYKTLETQDERDAVYDCAKGLTEYLHDSQIPNLVLADRSARPMSVAVMEYWKNVYPDETRPNIYFINPWGFQAFNKSAHEKYSPDETGRVSEEFANTYKELMKDKDKPVMLFDICIHSGYTLSGVVKAMEHLGFDNLIIGTGKQSDSSSRIPSDAYFFGKYATLYCKPFGRSLVMKTSDSVHSVPVGKWHRRDIQEARDTRKEIKHVINEGLEEDKTEYLDSSAH